MGEKGIGDVAEAAKAHLDVHEGLMSNPHGAAGTTAGTDTIIQNGYDACILEPAVTSTYPLVVTRV